MKRFLTPIFLLALTACGETDDADSCDPAECTQPPASVCLVDAIGFVTSTIVAYSNDGTCVLDRCVYQATQADCPGDCVPEFDDDGEPTGAQCSVSSE
ncbi:MAG: hypothetical protein ACJAYU_000548 [Bradymonadia bacterium]|jgi:hypothetical protein